MKFFENKKLSDRVTSITDITGVHSFLIQGTQRAALVDTGTGTGNIKEYVETLTSLPLTVILTHGHCDHAGGDAPFEEVWLNEADWELVGHHASMEMKTDYVKFCLGDAAGRLTEKDFMKQRTSGYKPLKDGQTFPLGGLTLEVITVPGHTRGMSCVLLREERSIIFGDACNPSVFLWAEEAAGIAEYRESLLHLKTREEDYDTVYLSHGEEVIPKKLLDGVLEVCEEILAGKADNQPFAFMGHEGIVLAKKADASGRRLDGKLGNIVYCPGKGRQG